MTLTTLIRGSLSSQVWRLIYSTTCIQKLATLASAVPGIWSRTLKLKMGHHVTPATFLLGRFVNRKLGLDIIYLRAKFKDSSFCRFRDIIGGAKYTRRSATAEKPRDALRQLKYYGRFLTGLLTRNSATPEEPCEHTVSWNRVKCCTNVRRIACEYVCNWWMTFKVIQGHCRW